MWKPITPADGNSGGPFGTRRVYGEDGKQYPRLVIGVGPVTAGQADAIKIFFSYKHRPEEWWAECSLPKQLIPDLVAMLNAEF